MYNKLQYISQGKTIQEQIQNIRIALDNGCEWIQLRFKNESDLDLFNLAETVKILCDVYHAHFIINDKVYLAQQIEADGIHLGNQDMSIPEARSILGDKKIIGATANTYEDLVLKANQNCNYIGLGPFQFTETKQKLSPILGLEGYTEILKKTKKQKIKTPIYAIGGIKLENITALMATGIHGIAVSSLITQSQDSAELIKSINEKLYGNVIV
jgi:thiamine-phosphate pyrophosphorylase